MNSSNSRTYSRCAQRKLQPLQGSDRIGNDKRASIRLSPVAHINERMIANARFGLFAIIEILRTPEFPDTGRLPVTLSLRLARMRRNAGSLFVTHEPNAKHPRKTAIPARIELKRLKAPIPPTQMN
jgi:hypothetical protein